MSKDASIPVWMTFPLSGASGMTAWLFAHPFEMMKNRIILNPHTTPLSESVRQVQQVGWYRGLSAGLNRQVVYATCRIGFYAPVRDLISAYSNNGGGSTAPTPVQRAAAGAISGSMASFCSSPVEVCLVLQTKNVNKAHYGFFDAVKECYTSSGVLGFWRGAIPLMTRAAVVGVSQVAMYDQLYHSLTPYFPNSKQNSYPLVSTASTLTGLFYSIITMPIELARVRMSAEQGKETRKYKNMVQTISLIIKEEGAGSIFKSYLPYFMRCTVHTVALFIILDVATKRVKALLNSNKVSPAAASSSTGSGGSAKK